MASNTILVVDADSVFRTSLTDILTSAGYKAHGASDNRSAVSLAESLGTEIDLMIVNMALPDISGNTLIDSIGRIKTPCKNGNTGLNVASIVVTAWKS
jgi:DNA-binding response OmpR family regulator